MPRPPIGKQAMTPAERQQKRRKRLKKEKLVLGRKAEVQRHRLKAATAYMPMPPGITYWRKVTVCESEIWSPTTQPLAAIEIHDGLSVLADADIERLLRLLTREAARRTLPLPAANALSAPEQLTAVQATAASLLQATQVRPLEPGESCTIGPAV